MAFVDSRSGQMKRGKNVGAIKISVRVKSVVM
jgi:hypothetical protein